VRAALLAIALWSASAASAAHAEPRRPVARPVPSYDGRAQPQATAGDVALAAARAILFPIRLVVHYGVRWPLGKLISAAERSRDVRRAIRYLFLEPPTPTMSITPIAFYDFGFQSSIGLRFSWTDGFLTPGSKFSLKLGTGGADWWRGDAAIIVAVPQTRGFRAGFGASIRRRPDQQFFGLGPRTPHSARARYLSARFGVTADAGWRELAFRIGSTSTFTSASHFHDAASIEDQVAAGRIAALPASYGALVETQHFGARISLDSRGAKDSPERERERDGSGVRLDGIVERVRARDLGHWSHVDATLGAALRLDPPGEHKLDLRLRFELVEPPDARGGGDIPFLELATIGGSRDLRGFASGRGRGLSAAALTLDYQWPLAAWLDATLYLGAGNVFGRRLSGLTAGKLRGSIGMGLALAGLTNERQLELWAAAGTEPFDEGAQAKSFRLVFGYSHDY
jgi:hypothetical protein